LSMKSENHEGNFRKALTLTAEKAANPAILATAFVFPMDRQMYSSLDGQWDPVACDTNTGCIGCNKATALSSFTLTDLSSQIHRLICQQRQE
jgi:hypothetical protein